MAIKPRAALARIEPYVPGKSPDQIQSNGEAIQPVKLSSNENPYGPAKSVPAAIAAVADQVHFYPDGGSTALKERLAARHQVSFDQIVLGCGSDEVIRMLSEAYLDEGSPVVIGDVTFSQYAFGARLMNADEVIVPLRDGRFDLPSMAEAINQSKARLCFVCNPNNPTGGYVTREECLNFLDAIPEDVLVVFDEAYIEYVDAPDFPDLVPLIREGRPIVCLRTFSKVHALAGLRVGYGIAPSQVARDLERIRPPFNVNLVAQAAALAALDDEEHVQKSVQSNQIERNRLTEAFKSMGLEPWPSQTNFIWVDMVRPAAPVYEALLNRGVIVRLGAAFGVDTALRITIGTTEQNDRLLAALKEILAV